LIGRLLPQHSQLQHLQYLRQRHQLLHRLRPHLKLLE
jgi:hypothetical protein